MVRITTAVLIVLVAVMAVPPVLRGDEQRAPTERTIAQSPDVVVSFNDSGQRRRRHRPKRRGGKYEVVTVDNGGSIEGVVIFTGVAPAAEKIQVVKDHKTCDQRSKTRSKIKVDSQGRVADAVVFLGDIKAGKAIATPATKPTIKQEHCTFVPHVQVIHTRQLFDVVNADPVAHNARCVQNMVTLFNPMQPKQGLRNEFSIKRPGYATVTCAVHNWMKAFIYVLWHPYHAVTGEDGKFVLADIPPGEYELVVWQEHLGERTTKVLVEAGKATSLTFDLEEK